VAAVVVVLQLLLGTHLQLLLLLQGLTGPLLVW
jgi:hypothetical protein